MRGRTSITFELHKVGSIVAFRVSGDIKKDNRWQFRKDGSAKYYRGNIETRDFEYYPLPKHFTITVDRDLGKLEIKMDDKEPEVIESGELFKTKAYYPSVIFRTTGSVEIVKETKEEARSWCSIF